MYNFRNMYPFDYTALAGRLEGWDPLNLFNHTSWVAVAYPTDRSKSVRNRCVIKVLVAFCVVT